MEGKTMSEKLRREMLMQRLHGIVYIDQSKDLYEAVADCLLCRDIVPVVRCKDCKHTDDDGCGAIYCEKWDRWEMPEDFFCSYGERKNNE
jgi:hypothetical protein